MLVSLVRRYEQVPWLAQMRRMVERWWNIQVIYIDRTHHPIFTTGQPQNLANKLCAACLSNDRGQSLCLGSMAQVQADLIRGAPDGEPAGSHRGAVLSRACHLGQCTMVLPIIIEASYRGMIYTTGFLDRPLSNEEEQRILERGGQIDPGLARAGELHRVPILTPENLAHLDDFLQLGGMGIVAMFSELKAKEDEIEDLRRQLDRRQGFSGIVGRSPSMQEVYRLVERVADNDCTVLVRGESGTGKELVAKAIHARSHRKQRAFVVQNCSAFNDSLLESELFGHVRGAFTGAISDKKGLFEIADGGTLFLDEVAEMSPALQAKLLRVLQDGTFWPVGATHPKRSDVRIVAATHRNLERMVEQEHFRDDLYYRLNVISITLPPLRERRGDIPMLAKHFLKQRGRGRLTGDAMRILSGHDWPGNVRELANEIERMTVLADGNGDLGRELISPRILQTTGPSYDHVLSGTLREALRNLESRMIRSALEQCGGNKSQAAKILGMARSNLIVKIKAYGLS